MLNTFIYLLMIMAALFMVASREIIRSLIWLSVFSILLTFQYALLQAPDVAITEAALGTGLSTLVFLTAIRKTREKPQQRETTHGGSYTDD